MKHVVAAIAGTLLICNCIWILAVVNRQSPPLVVTEPIFATWTVMSFLGGIAGMFLIAVALEKASDEDEEKDAEREENV